MPEADGPMAPLELCPLSVEEGERFWAEEDCAAAAAAAARAVDGDAGVLETSK